MKEFQFSSSARSELTDKLSVFNRLRELLENDLTISDYTDKYTAIFVIYQVFASDDIYCQYKEKMTIRRKTNVIELYLNPDYNKFKEADNKTALQMLANTYFHGIKKYLSKRNDFDHKKFYEDVMRVFVKIGG